MVGWTGSEPVRLVEEPELRQNGARLDVQLWVRGMWVSHSDWQGRFMSQVSQAQIHANLDSHTGIGDRYRISGSCADAELEEYIEKLDSMIGSANDWFEAEILPGLVEQESQQRQREEAKLAEDAALKERARKLRRPD